MDIFDRRLLAALQADGGLTNQQLAEKVGLSASQVSRRRQQLETDGLIEGYVARLSAEKLGLGVRVFVHVSLANHSPENSRRFAELVARTPEIQEAHALTGEADYLLKIAVRSLKDLASLVNDVLLPHESVDRVRSEIVLETLKESIALPL
ncbi:MAG: Lrp/AsnC family transcriptional regulator [Beijerinckiaceae bacterium]